MYFAVFKNVAHSLEPSETPLGVSPGSKQCTTFLNLAKHDKIMSKNQFTGTAAQPQCNRKLCQFNNDQYCNGTPWSSTYMYGSGSDTKKWQHLTRSRSLNHIPKRMQTSIGIIEPLAFIHWLSLRLITVSISFAEVVIRRGKIRSRDKPPCTYMPTENIADRD